MKRINIWYWIVTVLFAVFMIGTSWQDVVKSPDAVKFMTELGYPLYFIPFIGVLKIIGGIALLVPISPKIKEWAYAGFAFDLIGACYSNVCMAKPGQTG